MMLNNIGNTGQQHVSQGRLPYLDSDAPSDLPTVYNPDGPGPSVGLCQHHSSIHKL